MSNPFYTPSGVPATGAAGASSPMRAQFTAIEAAFDLMGALTANRIIHNNAGGTSRTTTSGFTFDGTTFTAPALAVTNNSVLTGDLAVNGGDLTSTASTFNLLASNATTVNAFGAATAITMGGASGGTGFLTALTWRVLKDLAIPAGGTAGLGYSFSSTANFGIYFGSGAPSLAAAKGSLYLRSDGSGTTNRAYINTDGAGTWTALTTAA